MTVTINGKEINTVASDIDGTLLIWPDAELSDEVLRCVRELLDAGITFIAASGRQYENMRKVFAPVKDEIYFVCENGSAAAYKDELILSDCIDETTARELIRDIRKHLGDIDTIVSSCGSVYGEERNADFIHFVNEKRGQCFRLVESFADIKTPINKISVVFPDGDVSHGKLLRDRYAGRLSVADAGGGWLDFTSLTASKGAALQYLKEKVLPPETSMACFGDSENDVSMFPVGELSFAMSHSTDEVKAKAGGVCANVPALLMAALWDGSNPSGNFRKR